MKKGAHCYGGICFNPFLPWVGVITELAGGSENLVPPSKSMKCRSGCSFIKNIAHWDIVLQFVPLLKSSQSVSKRSTDRLNLTTWLLAGKLLTPADLCVIRWRWSFVQSERSISVSTIQCWIYFLEAAHTMLLYGLILFSATAGMNSNFKMKIVCNRT